MAIFYLLDLIIGYTAPILFYVLYRLKLINKFSLKIFWIGAAIGLTWEIPMFVGSYETTTLVTLKTINPNGLDREQQMQLLIWKYR